MISYKRLKVVLAEKDMTKTELREKVGISTATLAKFDKGEPVSLKVIEKICLALECKIEEVVEIMPDPEESPDSAVTLL